MATPIGHGLAGYLVYRGSCGDRREDKRTLLYLCLFMSIAPDLDFLPGIFLGQPALYHQGISHSLGFAFLASFGLALLYSRRRTLLADWGRFFMAYSSHLIMDFFAPDGRPPYGLALFWPISGNHYLAPFPLFWGVHHVGETSASTTEWVISLFNLHNLGAMGVEIGLLLMVIFLVNLFFNKKLDLLKRKIFTSSSPPVSRNSLED